MKLKKSILVFLLFFICFLFLANAKYVSTSVISSLEFCYKSLIPSLFPFMILSSIILYITGTCCYSKNNSSFFDNCKIYKNEILLGIICGFVIGAKGICEKYDSSIDEKDFTRAVIFSSNAGIGFVIGCVGGVIWKNILFGIFLYICQILSAIIIYKLSKNKKEVSIQNISTFHSTPLFSAIFKSIKNSVNSILIICGFNIFFSAISDLIIHILGITRENFQYVFINVFMDFSKGVFCITQLNNLSLCTFLTGFCVGFGGICAHMQIFAECENYPLSKFRFFISKLLQGILCGNILLIFTPFLNIK